jgi:hypothetical protein
VKSTHNQLHEEMTSALRRRSIGAGSLALLLAILTWGCSERPQTPLAAVISPTLAKVDPSPSAPCDSAREISTIGNLPLQIEPRQVAVCNRERLQTFQFSERESALELNEEALDWSSGFTFESWLSPDTSSPPFARIIEALATSISPRGFGMELWPGRTKSVRLVIWEHGGSQFIDSRDTVPANQWSAVAITYEADAFRSGEGLVRVYVNGSPDPHILRAHIPRDRLKAVIGRNVIPRSESFRGDIAKIILTSRALSEHEVLLRCRSMESTLPGLTCRG